MANIFFYPYPNEILFRIVARYHVMSINRNISQTMEDLFGSTSYSPFIYFQSHLDFFCKQLPANFKYSPELLIENHTIYPLFRPFLWSNLNYHFFNNMKFGSSNSIYIKIGINEMGRYKFSEYKLCPRCMEEDEKKFGEIYFHVTHQVPGNYLCQTHKVLLSKYEVNTDNNHFINFDIDKNKDNFIPIEINGSIYPFVKSISQDIESIFINRFKNYSLADINSIYRTTLRKICEIANNSTVMY